MKKICVITGTRADYGLQHHLLKELKASAYFELQLVVTGTHLTSQYGMTYKEIEDDGFIIDGAVDMLLSSDSVLATTKSMALALIGFAEHLDRLNPDMLMIVGDRYEALIAATAANMANLPIAHIHGGELTSGAIDDNFRHAITKLSNLHFTATEPYKKRVIQLGEKPDRVFNVGGLAIDNINNLILLTKQQLEKELQLTINEKTYLITYHPVTLSNDVNGREFIELLAALDRVNSEVTLIFTMPNADPGNKTIADQISNFIKKRQNAYSFNSLGRHRYLSLLQFATAMIGNSSSGLIEAPSFNMATINIGDRQGGRTQADSVFDVEPNCEAIEKAINALSNEDIRQKIKDTVNPYGEGGAANKILTILMKTDISKLLKKEFHDLH